MTTAFAWDTTATATTATVTAFLELLAIDPAVEQPQSPIADVDAGLWNGVVIRELASDRNVAAIAEQEANRVAVDAGNDVPSQAEFLGELATGELSGDENRRLGFIVDGAISTRSDVDVYSFVAEAGTEVFFDIDKTTNSLDTIVELVDFAGNVLAGSNDSILASSRATPIGDTGSLYYDPAVIDAAAVLPLQVTNRSEPVQEFQINQRIDDLAADPISGAGRVTVTVGGVAATINLPSVAEFAADPDGVLRSVLVSEFPDLGAPRGHVAA